MDQAGPVGIIVVVVSASTPDWGIHPSRVCPVPRFVIPEIHGERSDLPPVLTSVREHLFFNWSPPAHFVERSVAPLAKLEVCMQEAFVDSLCSTLMRQWEQQVYLFDSSKMYSI
jgi:hypothetical protein